MTTVNTVNSHPQEISHLRHSVDTVKSGQTELDKGQADIYSKITQIHSLATKAYFTAAESKQRSSKGNFSVQGDNFDVPDIFLNLGHGLDFFETSC